MYKNYKVVVVTPAGRQKHLSILKRYIYSHMEEGLIDGWQLWQNTGSQSDIEYMRSMAAENPKVQLYSFPDLTMYDAYRICQFFQYAQDEETIYLRFDDDICFLAPNAVTRLLESRISNPEPYVICANIVNNTVMSWIHQKLGLIDAEHGKCGYARMDGVAWTEPAFVENIHRTFMRNYPAGLDGYEMRDWHFTDFEPFSISCFAFFGKDHLEPASDEEMFISSHKPQELNRPNIVCGNAVVCHYAYHTQREYVESIPEIYDFYNSIV